ncbi:uncharacterized protein Z520_02868 [Fonsecaea multimorphosa CBS 102226]|uniref:Uncharacterized protein n=1 Tax=Fonsecaea multimorphosa CBS 102226 TaxID=1442371 RepID=A0A0D2HHD0_9EURO|nr:uncharacterized protein Z520_02868 [Fonsecaea multimorphosa CBS 102226]KIY01316.1 hypothetical protein Z520_02868 [Fonsecaea multimorphosa CBS 102226]OAL28593.1 hypothetical protein AYO22_02787 [Fonsecaea multimorphosa]
MVRIKHRYLLFNILYPSAPTSSSIPAPAPAPALGPGSTPKEAPTPPAAAYILFLRPSPGHLTPALLVTHVRNQIQTLFGDHGVSVTQSSLRLVYFSPSTSTGILRVPRAHFRLVWASLTFLTNIPPPSTSRAGGGAGGRRGGREVVDATAARPELACVVRVVRVSGTIRKSEEELLRRARREVVRAKLQGRSTGEEGDNDTVLEGIFAGQNGRGPRKGKEKADAVGFMGAEEESIVDFDEDEEDFENDSG